MANWSNPLLTSTYTNFLAEVKARDEDLAVMFDGATTSNLPVGTIRWSSSANRWQKWSGTAWGELTTTYALTGLSTTGNASIGGTLAVTGATTLAAATATTPATADNSTAVATTAYVRAQGYVSAASPALTGTPTAPTATAGTNTTQLATTAFVAGALTTLNASNLTSGTVPDARISGGYSGLTGLGLGATLNSGPITAFGAITGGSGYVSGTYTNVALTGGSGAGATATVTVTSGVVTAVTLSREGLGYLAGDSLSAANTSLGGTGSGFAVAVSAIRLAAINGSGTLTSGLNRIRLANNSTGLAAGTELGSILFASNDADVGGRGDKVRVVAVAEGASGGGLLQIWTSSNGGEPNLAAAFGGNNDFRLYNAGGTFYHTFSNAPTANRTITLADGNTTLVAGTMAPVASPAFTGTPTAPTAAVSTNTTQIATTAFVNAEIANDAPTKTGGGASGSWAISVTGSAATATSATTAGSATNLTGTATSSINSSALASGTANSTTFLRGDRTWQVVSTTPTTAQVLDATAGLTAGAVGSYGLFNYGASFVNLAAGSTTAGSNLDWSNAGGTISGTPSGTWRLLGYITSQSNLTRTSVFVRIS